jgi:hypothetical protein
MPSFVVAAILDTLQASSDLPVSCDWLLEGGGLGSA